MKKKNSRRKEKFKNFVNENKSEIFLSLIFILLRDGFGSASRGSRSYEGGGAEQP